jgi:hypothetical protein
MPSDDDRDQTIEETRLRDQAGTVSAKREAAEKRKQIRIFSAKAVRIKKANDARAFGELLRGDSQNSCQAFSPSSFQCSQNS